MWLVLFIVMIIQGVVSLEEIKNEAKVNPEMFMNISERIQHWGYPCEEYEVLTADGYYLTLNRIPGGSKAAIVLVHGLNMEGSIWVANLPNSSLGFMLADAGYDVWIGNGRGNSWSRRHKFLTVDQEEFWDFSFHEMGIYDLPAITDFVLQKSRQEKIYYVGHSQGSTIALVAFSEKPELVSKIKMFFALGPAYTLQHTMSPILQLLRSPEAWLKIIFGTKEFSLLSPRTRALVAQSCRHQLLDVVCKQVLLLNSGFNEKNLNESRTDVYMSGFPDYTSVKNLIHWSQVAKMGKPRKFDYGSCNKDIYNQTTPPLYKIEEVTVPVAIWSGGQDWVCQSKEIEELNSRLKNVILYKNFPDWNHWDFIWGLDAPQRLYMEILRLMEK